MTTLRETVDYVNQWWSNIDLLPEVVRSKNSVKICLHQMVREPHDGQSNYLDGRERVYVSCGQMEDYAVQLQEWLYGETESRPHWTTYPTHFGYVPAEISRLASWAVYGD